MGAGGRQVEQVRGGHLPCRAGGLARLQGGKVAKWQGGRVKLICWHRFELELERIPPLDSEKDTCLAGQLSVELEVMVFIMVLPCNLIVNLISNLLNADCGQKYISNVFQIVSMMLLINFG